MCANGSSKQRCKTQGNEARVETISAKRAQDKESRKSETPRSRLYKIASPLALRIVYVYVYVCIGKRRNERISLSPPSYFASLSLLRCSSTDIEIVNVWRSVKHFPQSRVCCLINSASQPPSSVRLSRPDFALHMQLINAMHKLTSEQNQIHSTRLQLM